MRNLIKIFLVSIIIVVCCFASFVACNKTDNTGDADQSVTESVNDSSREADGSISQGGNDSSSQEGGTPASYEEMPSSLTVLFQGDSITDNTRSREDTTDLGGGYAAMVADSLKKAYGNKVEFTFINRANSGWNLIDDWNKGGVDHYEDEFYQYDADIATILIGYNDIMDAYPDIVSDDEFRSCYRNLLEGLKERGTIAICMAAFDIVGYGTEFEAKRNIVKNLATEFDFPYIDMKPYMMQAVEDGAYKMELFGDLTHPWAAGCRIISELVTDKISAVIDKDYVTPSDLGKYKPLTTVADNAEDMTNLKAFLHCSHDVLKYDTEEFYNEEGFVSTQSLMAIHENKEPYHNNSYTRVLIDWSDKGEKDLSKGVLTFDLKFDNFIPWLSVQAYNVLQRYNPSAMSPEYGVNLSETNKATALENGWYRITIDLADWAAADTNKILNNAVAIVITASKGEDPEARARFNVDGGKDSIMWIDNLRLEFTPVVIHTFDGSDNMSLRINASKVTDVLSLKYKKKTAGNLSFAILPKTGDNSEDWINYIGYITIGDEAAFSEKGVTLTADEDDWYKIEVDLSEVDKYSGDKTIAEGYNTYGLLFFNRNNNSSTFDIKEIIIEKK